MKTGDVVEGAIVRVKNLEPLDGTMCHQEYLTHRRADAQGPVTSFQRISETGGYTLIFVKHGGGTTAYWNTELELLGVPE